MSLNIQVDVNKLIEQVNFKQFVEQMTESPYGLTLLAFVLVIILLIFIIYFISKFSILNIIREHQEYKIKKTNDEITYLQELLKDETFKNYTSKIKYDLAVAKLCKLLKYNHHDKDLLEYIWSCKNSKLAIQLYESSKFQLEKDETTKEFKLKKYFPNWWVLTLNYVGTSVYFVLTLSSLYPTFYLFYYSYKTGENINNLPFKFYISQILLFLIFFVIALAVLNLFIKPWKGKKFLELEKIEADKTQSNILNEAA